MSSESRITSEWAALVLSLLVLAAVAVGISACGGDDIFFPGEIPATSTEEPTTTPEDT